jgi:signal recognition particle receptor subunit beta
MFINRRHGELYLKIVYYGPALSGKTTNLEYIHQHTPPQRRGEMVSLKTRGDRTIFFDYMQFELPPIRGLTPKFNLYTVPGQVAYASSRRLVLQGADGVIFVADSQAGRENDNLYALVDLYTNLKKASVNPRQVSLIIQFNKRDLENAVTLPDIRQALCLNGYTFPCYEASAIEGKGVIETLKASINAVVKRIQTGI